MARLIEPTPTLYGEDAKKVLKEIEKNSYSKKKAKFLKQCRKAYKRTKR